MFGFQAEGSAPIVRGHVITNPETIASAIRIGNPASWELATAAREATDGYFGAISDKLILEAHRILSAEVGIFVEPASAIGVAGLLERSEAGAIPKGATVVHHRHRARAERPAVGRAQRRRNGRDAHRGLQGHRRGGQRARSVEVACMMAGRPPAAVRLGDA